MELEEMFEAPSISADEAITGFIRLDQRVKEAAQERAMYSSVLTQSAVDQRNGQATVHLEASSGSRVKVEFKKGFSCDQSELECARELLGDEKFSELFKTEHSPKAKNLKTFLNTKFANEKIATAQEIIRAAVQEVERSPYVSVEKS
jgi:hypothetical protein